MRGKFMAILHDYHLHTSFSGDSDTPMTAMIKAAQDQGMKGICITEHFDYDFPITDRCPAGKFYLDFDAYQKRFHELHTQSTDKFDLCFGVEFGLQPHLAALHNKLADAYPFDFIIGSVHTCHAKDPYYEPFYEGRPEEEAYREYFSCILENLEAYDNFDTLGHLDYTVRYGPNKDTYYTYELYRDVLDPVLTKLVSMGKALECNTGAINYGLKDLNPSNAILKRYRELGGEYITIGSDAHVPEAIAKGFDRARQVLLDCGFTYYTTFHNRKPVMHRL